MKENDIREYLSQNIKLLSNDLTVLQQEYPLNNPNGAKGYIDILAKDHYNNYVIIEIKRSDQAARQALHEIFKYSCLLKSSLRIKDSELRIIIVSTTWHELLIPFSEYCNKMDLYVEGYRLDLEDDSIVRATRIKPVEISSARNLSRHQCLFLYEKENSLSDNLQIVVDAIRSNGIEDFIIIEQSTKESIPYPYAFVVVFQICTEQQYIELLRLHNPEQLVELAKYKANPENEYEEYFDYLEDSALAEIIKNVPHDTFEISYPEKLYNATISGWTTNKIYRFGFFEKDQRLTDDFLLYESMGLNGKNQHFYFDVCDTKFKTKLVETKKNLQNFLRFNSELSYLQEIIMQEVSNSNVDARFHFYFYNPDDIIWSIAYMKSSCTYKSLPMFNVIVDYSEGDILHTYDGYLVFSKRKTDLSGVINKYFHKDEFNYFMSKAIGGIALVNADIMNSFGLHFAMHKLEYRAGVLFEKKQVCLSNVHMQSFSNFIREERQLINDIESFYKRYSLTI